MTETPLLEMRNINKSFGPVHVLHDVDFSVYEGQVTALVGDNGAGKSTLVKCLAGIHQIDTGDQLGDREAARAWGLSLNEGFMEKEARRALASLSVRTIKSARQKVASLSGGQRQSVAIAKAVLWNSRVVVLDEPSA